MTYKLNKQHIEDLRNGKIAIDNSGNTNVELLNQILKTVFPKDINTNGNSLYYRKSEFTNIWLPDNKNNLPTIPLLSFIDNSFVLPEKWCISRDLTLEQNKIVIDWVNKTYKWSYIDAKLKNYYVFPTFSMYNHEDFVPKGYTEITFEQFKEHVMKIKEEFPKDDFGVIVENNNGKEIIDYLVSKGFRNLHGLIYGQAHFYGVNQNENIITAFCNSEEQLSKTYTLKQLKQLDNNNMKEKEIIGYKAPYDLFDGVVKKDSLYIKFKNGDHYYGKYDEKGKDNTRYSVTKEIVETWEPVYKSFEVTIRMGDKFDLVVRDGKVFHKEEDITDFVELLGKSAKSFCETGLTQKYPVLIKDIIFSKTGCQNIETKLSEWINVYNELQKQK